jgi:hypothetical protein
MNAIQSSLFFRFPPISYVSYHIIIAELVDTSGNKCISHLLDDSLINVAANRVPRVPCLT